MKIKTLIDDASISDKYRSEHGLSLYIQTEKHNILFDVGQSKLFSENAELMGVSIEDVDILIISHGHFDHGGGLKTFLELNQNAKIFINEKAFGDYFSSDSRYIGLNKKLKNEERITFVGDEFVIDEELKLFTGNNLNKKYEIENHGLLKFENYKSTADDFLHEQYLIVSEKEKKHLISGCMHKGILNIAKWAKNENVSTIIGGLHLYKVKLDESGINYINDIAKELLDTQMCFFTCHCTGQEQFEVLNGVLKDRIKYLSTGTTEEL